MQFNSLEFMAFFPVVIAVYFVIPRKCRSIWLLFASYWFYMSWSPKYALLIGFSTVVTYLCGIGIEAYRDSRKMILAAGLVVNLLILGLFKYGNFALGTLDYILRALRLGEIERRFNLLLPVGISFYTFQALGYVIDVYRGETRAEKNLIRYALFVSFFPQLVAGPIERSKNLLRQMREIEDIRLWNAERVTSGAILMIWGLFMKMVIADRAAILVDTVFDNYQMYGRPALLIAAAAFSFQIYCDFGSYSLVAIGAAKIMGFSLMENFNTPYFAAGIRDFWSRWHISLSTWFRDYLYIPLGGNRKGERRKALNLMIVFLVSGLWHGADWSFVLWGGIHGAMQVAEDVRNRKMRPGSGTGLRIPQRFLTFALVTFAWIFFRADSVKDAFGFIRQIISGGAGIAAAAEQTARTAGTGIFALGLDRVEWIILLVSLAMLFAVDLIRYRRKQTIDAFLMERKRWVEWAAVIVLIEMLFIFGEYGPAFDAQQFIYFQF